MADHGDGNIKVVVRCRPLNTRGESAFRHLRHRFFALFTLVNCRARARCKAAHSYVWKPNIPGSTRVGVYPGESILGSRNRAQDDDIFL